VQNRAIFQPPLGWGASFRSESSLTCDIDNEKAVLKCQGPVAKKKGHGGGGGTPQCGPEPEVPQKEPAAASKDRAEAEASNWTHALLLPRHDNAFFILFILIMLMNPMGFFFKNA
jgi:hypothetical protein